MKYIYIILLFLLIYYIYRKLSYTENFDPSLVPVSSLVTFAKIANRLIGNNQVSIPADLTIEGKLSTNGYGNNVLNDISTITKNGITIAGPIQSTGTNNFNGNLTLNNNFNTNSLITNDLISRGKINIIKDNGIEFSSKHSIINDGNDLVIKNSSNPILRITPSRDIYQKINDVPTIDSNGNFNTVNLNIEDNLYIKNQSGKSLIINNGIFNEQITITFLDSILGTQSFDDKISATKSKSYFMSSKPNIEGYKIGSLTGLTISGPFKLSDIAVKFAFSFPSNLNQKIDKRLVASQKYSIADANCRVNLFNNCSETNQNLYNIIKKRDELIRRIPIDNYNIHDDFLNFAYFDPIYGCLLLHEQEYDVTNKDGVFQSKIKWNETDYDNSLKITYYSTSEYIGSAIFKDLDGNIYDDNSYNNVINKKFTQCFTSSQSPYNCLTFPKFPTKIINIFKDRSVDKVTRIIQFGDNNQVLKFQTNSDTTIMDINSNNTVSISNAIKCNGRDFTKKHKLTVTAGSGTVCTISKSQDAFKDIFTRSFLIIYMKGSGESTGKCWWNSGGARYDNWDRSMNISIFANNFNTDTGKQKSPTYTGRSGCSGCGPACQPDHDVTMGFTTKFLLKKGTHYDASTSTLTITATCDKDFNTSVFNLLEIC